MLTLQLRIPEGAPSPCSVFFVKDHDDSNHVHYVEDFELFARVLNDEVFIECRENELAFVRFPQTSPGSPASTSKTTSSFQRLLRQARRQSLRTTPKPDLREPTTLASSHLLASKLEIGNEDSFINYKNLRLLPRPLFPRELPRSSPPPHQCVQALMLPLSATTTQRPTSLTTVSASQATSSSSSYVYRRCARLITIRPSPAATPSVASISPSTQSGSSSITSLSSSSSQSLSVSTSSSALPVTTPASRH
jgi:hypothetical protein